jgi:hypothetical protein
VSSGFDCTKRSTERRCHLHHVACCSLGKGAGEEEHDGTGEEFSEGSRWLVEGIITFCMQATAVSVSALWRGIVRRCSGPSVKGFCVSLRALHCLRDAAEKRKHAWATMDARAADVLQCEIIFGGKVVRT